MDKGRDDAAYLQFFRVRGRVGGIHRKKGDSGPELQALDGEFSICFRDDNITLHRRFRFVYHHEVA
nr:hypothetical protein [Enterobacter sp.]